jgi:hypothetical protein
MFFSDLDFQTTNLTQVVFLIPIFLFIFRLRAFFETLPNDKQPGFLCPDYAGFLGITEKHFYESLSSVLDTNVDCRYWGGIKGEIQTVEEVI